MMDELIRGWEMDWLYCLQNRPLFEQRKILSGQLRNIRKHGKGVQFRGFVRWLIRVGVYPIR